DLDRQIGASGATWLDHRLVERTPTPLAMGGFGGEVREAMKARAEHLIAEGLAQRRGGQIIFQRDLLATLRGRELNDAAAKLSAETGLPCTQATAGNQISGVYRQRLALASGRFAMIDDGLGFQFVPWSPTLEKKLGQHVSGITRDDGGIEWSIGRKRGLGL
ncbi:MAG: type VI secretion protein, partial [Methylocystaceae bacterium]